jgi:hypothetical protein
MRMIAGLAAVALYAGVVARPRTAAEKKTAGNLGEATGGTRTERGGRRGRLARVERQTGH